MDLPCLDIFGSMVFTSFDLTHNKPICIRKKIPKAETFGIFWSKILHDDALLLLDACPPEEFVPEAEGMTVGRLAEIIHTLCDREKPA